MFGLASCGGDALAALQPKILKDALAAMRSAAKPGIVVRIPKDPGAESIVGIGDRAG